MRLKSSAWLVGPALLLLWVTTQSTSAFTLITTNDLVFVSVDHAPMGTCSFMGYGYKGQICGVGTSSGYPSFWNGGGGILIGLSGNSGMQLLPFVGSASSISTNAHFFADTRVQRTLGPCTDAYAIDGTALAFTHYNPAWQMTDLNAASLSDRRRFFLPATWMVFTVNNTNTTPEDLYFGLPVAATQRTFSNGAYQGFVLGEAALAAQSGTCELL